MSCLGTCDWSFGIMTAACECPDVSVRTVRQTFVRACSGEYRMSNAVPCGENWLGVARSGTSGAGFGLCYGLNHVLQNDAKILAPPVSLNVTLFGKRVGADVIR